MNGVFFILDTDTSNITSMSGKYLSHYNETWCISKEPERSATASGYGSTDEWETLFDIEAGSWIPVPEKQMSALGTALSITGANIVDVNVVGPLVDYVVQYQAAGQNLYYRDRNIDGIFITTNYSVYAVEHTTESILGPYNEEQSYIKQFSNSVMLYSNLRLIVQGTVAVSLSYAVVSSRIGTILVPFGDIADDTIPILFLENDKHYIVSKTADGYVRIMRLGTDIQKRITRMAQYVHRINTVDTMNILVEREGRITVEPGSLDWNNRFEIINGMNTVAAQEPTTYHINSAYNPIYEITGRRSSSMIVSSTTFTLYGKLYNDPIENGYSLDFINAELDYPIDVFSGTTPPPEYSYSLLNGTKIFNSVMEGLPFPDGVIVPFPVGTKWNLQNDVVAVGEMSYGIMSAGLTDSNKTLDLYLYSSQLYFGRASFILYGIQYVFDGDYIYQDSERIAMAFGYVFSGSDNNSAYFYNPWDKSMYQFTGSRNLSKILNLSNREMVKAGRYDGFSGEMVLLTENEILKNRSGTIMNFPYIPGKEILPTKKGPYIEIEDGSFMLISPREGDIDDFELQTEHFGVDGSTVCDYERVDIRLYSPEKKPIIFTAVLQTINQETRESENKTITINGGDWSQDGYKTVKLIPKYKKGTGLSLRIYSEGLIHIAGIEFTYNQVARTANSQRSGF